MVLLLLRALAFVLANMAVAIAEKMNSAWNGIRAVSSSMVDLLYVAPVDANAAPGFLDLPRPNEPGTHGLCKQVIRWHQGKHLLVEDWCTARLNCASFWGPQHVGMGN